MRHALDQHNEEYALETLEDGEEAIRFIQQQRTSLSDPEPCVIVLDVHLPKHDGPAVLKALRAEPALSSVQVVALSTLAAPQDEDELRGLGVSLYRTKPTDLDDWIALAGEILEICKQKAHDAAALA